MSYHLLIHPRSWAVLGICAILGTAGLPVSGDDSTTPSRDTLPTSTEKSNPAKSSAPYQILWQTVNDAGGPSTNGVYSVEGSAGEVGAGDMANSVYRVAAGYVSGVTLCECGIWGDVSGDGAVNPVDVVKLVNFVYKGLDQRNPLPVCPKEPGDVNCNGAVNPVDVVLYVNYVYKGLTPFPCTDPCS